MPKSLKAKEVMSKEVFTIGPEATLAETINKLIENKISGMPVIDDDGEMVGIVSEKDILNFAFCGYLHNTKVQEAMTQRRLSILHLIRILKKLLWLLLKNISAEYRSLRMTEW